jgi:hypothetical protein
MCATQNDRPLWHAPYLLYLNLKYHLILKRARKRWYREAENGSTAPETHIAG